MPALCGVAWGPSLVGSGIRFEVVAELEAMIGRRQELAPTTSALSLSCLRPDCRAQLFAREEKASAPNSGHRRVAQFLRINWFNEPFFSFAFSSSTLFPLIEESCRLCMLVGLHVCASWPCALLSSNLYHRCRFGSPSSADPLEY